MQTIKKGNKSIVFTRFFLSYLAILLIPFLIFSGLIFGLIREIKENSIRESSYMLGAVRDEVDYKMKTVYASILNLNYNVTIRDLLNSPEKEKDIAKLLTARDEIGYLEDDGDTIYIYLPDEEALLSSKGVYSQIEKLYGKIFSYGDMDYQEFYEQILNGDAYHAVLPETRVTTNSRESSAILYVAQIPFGPKTGKKAKVLFFIDSGNIHAMTEDYVQNGNSWFGIYTKDQTPVCTTNGDPGNGGLLPLEYDASGEPRSDYEMDGYLYTTAQSNYNGWVFVSGIAKKDLFAQVTRIQIGILFLFSVYALAGCCAAYYIAAQNLRPLRTILSGWNREPKAAGGKINEYQMLEDYFQDIIRQNQELTISNEDYMERMKEIWLQNLICGRYNTREEIEELKLSEISEYHCFAVLILDFSSGSLMLEGQSIDDLNARRYLVKKWLKEMEFSQTAATEIDLCQVGILFYSNAAQEDFEEETGRRAGELLAELKKSMGEDMRAGKGEAVTGALRIGYSFIQARCAVRACLEYRKDYMAYGGIPRKNEKYYFPDQLREMLIDAVPKGNLKQVNSIFKVLKVENFDTRDLSAKEERQFLEEIWSVMLHLKNKDLISTEEMEVEERIRGEDLYYLYVQKIQSACMQKTEQAFSEKKKIQQELMQFIDEHYMDSGLCLSMAAKQFHLSESYLSYLFKKSYGINFSSYLENKRIGQAKLLLLEGTYSIEEVGRMTGYNSAHVFRRAFRKVTGCNPSDLLKT